MISQYIVLFGMLIALAVLWTVTSSIKDRGATIYRNREKDKIRYAKLDPDRTG